MAYAGLSTNYIFPVKKHVGMWVAIGVSVYVGKQFRGVILAFSKPVFLGPPPL